MIKLLFNSLIYFVTHTAVQSILELGVAQVCPVFLANFQSQLPKCCEPTWIRILARLREQKAEHLSIFMQLFSEIFSVEKFRRGATNSYRHLFIDIVLY